MIALGLAAALAAAPAAPAPAFPAPPAIPRIAQDDAPPVEIWQLDQLRIATDTPAAIVDAIEPLHTLDAVAAWLTSRKVAFVRTTSLMQPDRLPDAVRAQILGLPKGEPFVIPGADYIAISVIVARQLPPGAVRWRMPSPPIPSAAEA